jgi:hypothetical protein
MTFFSFFEKLFSVLAQIVVEKIHSLSLSLSLSARARSRTKRRGDEHQNNTKKHRQTRGERREVKYFARVEAIAELPTARQKIKKHTFVIQKFLPFV